MRHVKESCREILNENEVREMKKKVLFTSLSLVVASACVYGSFSTPLITEAYARSAPLEEEEDSKDAIKGKVTICAIFDENHKYPVTVDLCPTFDGGVHHYYTLTPENPTVSDKIAVGSYRTVSYLAEEDKDYGDAGTKVFAQRADVTVTESTESVAPSTVVIVADKGFIDKYAYELTSYRDDDGNALSGIYSESDAGAIYDENVAKQTGYDSTDAEDDETDKAKQEEIPEGEEANSGKKGFASYLKFIIPSIAVIAAATIAVIRKRKRG